MRTYGIDASALLKPNPTGVEKYVGCLLTALMGLPLLADEKVVLYAPKPQPSTIKLPANWCWRELPFWLPKGWTHLRLSLELSLHSPTVFFSPAHEIPLLPGRAKIVSTVHDVAFRSHPETYDRRGRARQELAIRRVRRLAHRVLAVSEGTKKDLVDLFAFDASTITVTPEAPTFSARPDEDEIVSVLAKYRLQRGQYLFFIGRIEEKKNVRTLIKAFLLLKERLGSGHPLKLVLAGSDGNGAGEIKAMTDRSQYKTDVTYLGYTDDAAVPALMAGARAFVFPSIAEGFGLPLLEGMKMGVPVIASDIPVFREIGGEAVDLVAPLDVDGFAKAFERIIFDEAHVQALVNAGDKQVAKYTWEATAERTLAALRTLTV